MNKRSIALFVCLVLSIVLPVWTQAKAATVVQSVAKSGEVRGLWVVRTTLTSPEKIRAMVQAATDNGFNTIIVQVRGCGDACYRSRKEPRASELKDQPAEFDPLAVTPQTGRTFISAKSNRAMNYADG